MDFEATLQRSSENVALAMAHEREGRWSAAVNSWVVAADHLRIFVRAFPGDKQPFRAQWESYVSRGEKIKEQISQRNREAFAARPDVQRGGVQQPLPASQPPPRPQPQAQAQANDASDAAPSTLLAERPETRWSDVTGLKEAKRALIEATQLPQMFPHLFEGSKLLTPCTGILLYGPPGTGKTLLARATAAETNSRFYVLSCSDVLSKWVGESAKRVRDVFDDARKNAPAVIFIDEIDKLVPKGGGGDGGSVGVGAQVLSELLQQMQGVGTTADGNVLVLAATNYPDRLDDAMVRRFQRRIHIAMPDEHTRELMCRELLVGDRHSLTGADFEEIVRQTRMFSGSDVKNMLSAAALLTVTRLVGATHWKRAGDKWTPCEADEQGAVPHSYTDFEKDGVEKEAIAMRHVEVALQRVRPSCTTEMIEKSQAFTDKYGSSGT